MNCSLFACDGKLILYDKSPYPSFGPLQNCSEPCNGVYMTEYHQNALQICTLVLSGICSLSALIVLLVYAVNFCKIRHPEASMFYTTLCYLAVSLAYILSITFNKYELTCNAKLTNAFNKPAVVQNALENPFCSSTFAMLYYSTLAGWTWWTILNIEWIICSFKMTQLQWKWAVFSHVAGWIAPLPFVIISLSIHAVSGNSNSMTCWISNGIHQLLLVIIPLIALILLNSSLLLVGFCIGYKKAKPNTLVDINNTNHRLSERTEAITLPNLMRTSIYSVMTLIIHTITMSCYLYEYCYGYSQEIQYLQHQKHLTAPTCYPDSSSTDYTTNALVISLLKVITTQIMAFLYVFWLIRKDLLCSCCRYKRQNLNTTITSDAIQSRSISSTTSQ